VTVFASCLSRRVRPAERLRSRFRRVRSILPPLARFGRADMLLDWPKFLFSVLETRGETCQRLNIRPLESAVSRATYREEPVRAPYQIDHAKFGLIERTWATLLHSSAGEIIHDGWTKASTSIRISERIKVGC
jgi:hypothetical protein